MQMDYGSTSGASSHRPSPVELVPVSQGLDLGRRLVAGGFLAQAQLNLALQEQRRNHKSLKQTLIDLRLVSAEVISEMIARDASTKLVRLNRLTIEREVLGLVPCELARRLGALPISRENGTLTVALSDPLNVTAVDALQQLTGLVIHVVAATEQDILNCLDRHYANGNVIPELIDRIIETEPEEGKPRQNPALDTGECRPEEAPVIQLVSEIITRAVRNGASDVHFEPEEKNLRIRTRIDGLLFSDVLIPKSMQSMLTTRLKIVGDMDVAESRMSQDGRATFWVDRRQVNLRISSLPNRHGENIVVRILDTESKGWQIASLGFSPEVEHQFMTLLQRPYGVIIITGPTGSGKSTTLYGALGEVDTKQLSVFTLEDPIEYGIPGISQTQVNEEIGMTFGRCLRTLLRQDPDVILVGETRDTETAQLMVRAALTGHLVLSTLHTNDAPGAIPRLVDMGVEPFLLPASLLGVLAQRLVRGICSECKEEIPNPEETLQHLGVNFQNLGVNPAQHGPLRLWRGVGCPACKRSGYKGRLGIFELMSLDERFHDAIVRRSGAPEYFRLAREAGMRTMFEDGMRKALEGKTSVEEVLRVTRMS